MIELVGSLISGVLGGGATGLLGVLLQRWFDHKKQQSDLELVRINHQNALALRTIELQAQERIAVRTAEAEDLIAQSDMQAREAEAAERSLQASFEADRATYLSPGAQQQSRAARWAMTVVDFLRGVIRPVGTAYLMVVTTSMFWWTTRLAQEYGVRMSADQVLTLQRTMIETVSYCAVTSWVWWFGVRSGQPQKR